MLRIKFSFPMLTVLQNSPDTIVSPFFAFSNTHHVLPSAQPDCLTLTLPLPPSIASNQPSRWQLMLPLLAISVAPLMQLKMLFFPLHTLLSMLPNLLPFAYNESPKVNTTKKSSEPAPPCFKHTPTALTPCTQKRCCHL